MNFPDDAIRPEDPAAIDGAAVLDAVHEALTRYVVLPSPEATDAVVLWIAATHAQPCWEHATRLVLKSPEKRCGKTRAMEVGRELVCRPRATVNISAAALVRSIHPTEPPTLLVDEADRLYGSKTQSEINEAVTGILNGGFARDWPYTRYNAARGCNEDHATFAMAMLASKGKDLPDTIEDRAVIVTMRRRAPGETVAPFRRRNVAELHDLRDSLAEWIGAHTKALHGAEPDMPVEDRAADVWESLTAVADLAGGDWPARARTAAKLLSAEADDAAEATLGVRLLAELKEVFAGATALHTATIIERLCALPEAPWSDYYGRRVTDRDLAKILRPYGVRSKTVREPDNDRTGKGYHAHDLADAWSRYVPEGGKRHKGNMGNSAGHSDEDVTDVTDEGSQRSHGQGADQRSYPCDRRDGTPRGEDDPTTARALHLLHTELGATPLPPTGTEHTP